MKDKTKPLFHWYVDSAVGKELVFALYTRPCRYGRCTFCSLPSMSEGGEVVTAKDIDRQVDYILSQYSEEQLKDLGKVSIYSASSVMDQECLPTRSLMYLLLKICDYPGLKVVSLETRPEYVEDWELKALRNVLGEEVQLEIGIGYETYDPELRNKVLQKGLTRKAMHKLMQMLNENKNCSLKAYLMLKPHHSLTEDEGIIEAINGLKELKNLSSEYRVPVSIHLNPTYIAEGCKLTDEMVANGYEPPELTSLIKVLVAARDLDLSIYAGLDDEGMAIEGGTYQDTDMDRKKAVTAIKAFNYHQDQEKLMMDSGYKN